MKSIEEAREKKQELSLELTRNIINRASELYL